MIRLFVLERDRALPRIGPTASARLWLSPSLSIEVRSALRLGSIRRHHKRHYCGGAQYRRDYGLNRRFAGGFAPERRILSIQAFNKRPDFASQLALSGQIRMSKFTPSEPGRIRHS
jgi:hypothetical protein